MPERRDPNDEELDQIRRFLGLTRDQLGRLLRQMAQDGSRRPPHRRRQADTPPPAPTPSRIQWLDQPTYIGGEEPQKPKPVPPAKPPAKEARVEWGGGETAKDDLWALVGMEDAFEHTPLLAGERIAYCTLDKVGYHLSTWRFLQDQNNGCCCVCGKRNTIEIILLPGKVAPAEAEKVKAPPAPLLRPGEKVVRIEEVEQYVNRAVTIEGLVYEVYRTKSTGTYFVRFEPRNFLDPPFKGFKLVIWPDYQPAFDLAGVDIRSFANCTIRVRGVIQKHETWGMELIVHSPHMIEVVEDPQDAKEEG